LTGISSSHTHRICIATHQCLSDVTYLFTSRWKYHNQNRDSDENNITSTKKVKNSHSQHEVCGQRWSQFPDGQEQHGTNFCVIKYRHYNPQKLCIFWSTLYVYIYHLMKYSRHATAVAVAHKLTVLEWNSGTEEQKSKKTPYAPLLGN